MTLILSKPDAIFNARFCKKNVKTSQFNVKNRLRENNGSEKLEISVKVQTTVILNSNDSHS